MSAFMMIEDNGRGDGRKVGKLVEYSPTTEMFSSPKDQRTDDYITGRFG
jgi:ABC-type phosphate transport system ATPase subunit